MLTRYRHLLLFAAIAPCFALGLNDFKTCITSGSAYSCTLDPKPGGGPYIIGTGAGADTDTLNVTRSGSPSLYGYNVTLKRKAGFYGALIRASLPAYVYYFTFEGDKFNNSPGTLHDEELQCLAFCGASSNKFYNSPWIAMGVRVTNSYASYNEFRSATVNALWMPGTGVSGFTAYNNSFYDTGTNGIIFTGSNGYITYNQFYRNHRNCFYNYPGGQLLINPGSSYVSIIGNVIADGPAYCDAPYSAYWADGMELYGSNLTVRDNTVTNNGGHGIGVDGVNGATISNGQYTNAYISLNNRRGLGFDGIRVQDIGLGGNSGINITSLRSTNGHYAGVGFYSNASSSSVTNNCVSGNQVGVYLCPTCSGVYQSNNTTSGC